MMRELLKNVKVLDEWQNTSVLQPNKTIHYIIFKIGNHYFCISEMIGEAGLVIDELESPDREAYEVKGSAKTFGKKKMKEYIKELIIRYEVKIC